MAKAGKILALVGAVLTILGTYLFTLSEIFPGVSYLWGTGGWINIGPLFQYATSGAPDAWQAWIVAIVMIIFLLSGLLMLLGIKSRIAAFFGCLVPLAVATMFILGAFGISVLGAYGIYFLFLGSGPVVLNVFPLTFEYPGLAPGGLGWGTLIIALGSLLVLISVFLTRED
ncbi:MAG: hypothetical protein EU530_02980 [Promethearchaeota archaeon]|nr:MAG: hypothetical protein EU530_02980 [Candidatus Lokiarchaeota archaeon]